MGRLPSAAFPHEAGAPEKGSHPARRSFRADWRRASSPGRLVHAWRKPVWDIQSTKQLRGSKTFHPDGSYTNILDGSSLKVSNSEAEIPVSATIFRYQAPALPKPFYSDLLDFD